MSYMKKLYKSMLLQEFSITRILKYVKDIETGGSFALISSQRGNWKNLDELEYRRNQKQKFENFKKDVRQMGYGYELTTGGWTETEGGENKMVTEPSFLIKNIELQDAQYLAQKYEQEAFMYAGPETEGNIYQYATNPVGKVNMVFKTDINMGRFKYGYTELNDSDPARVQERDLDQALAKHVNWVKRTTGHIMSQEEIDAAREEIRPTIATRVPKRAFHLSVKD